MKKVSTVATTQSRNISQQKLTIGLDLGDRNSWYCVLDEAGQIQLEQRVRTTAKALQEVFGAMPRSRIALEIGTHSPWISRLLRGLGHEVIVANARKVRLIGESRKKDDRLDAQTLARLARIDPELLYPVKHRSAQAQADLMMIRARAGLVRARTGLVNTARGLAKSYGERLRGCNVRNMNAEKAEGLSPELQRALEPLLGVTNEYPGGRPPLSPGTHGDAGAPRPDDLQLSDAANRADAAPQGLAFPCPVWLLPLRDLISVGVMLASYAGRGVEWRGHRLTADTPGRPAPGLTATD